jgi:hypothetical protein
MMLDHPLLDRLDTVLADAVPPGSASLHGDWASRSRRSYRTTAQLGSGEGPYVEVADHIWEGRLSAASALTGMVFLHAESTLHWAKAAHASQDLSLRVSLHGSADYQRTRITFAAGLDDAFVPSVPVEAGFCHPSECLVATDVVPVGRIARLASAGGRAFYILLLASESVRFGRNRLWRLRDSIAGRLPPDLRELLTRRRAGAVRHPSHP